MSFKRTLPAVALAGAAGLLSIPAVLAADETPRDAVDRLMPALLSSDEAERAKAEKELFALGDAGRSELERITRETDPRRAVTALRLLQSDRWQRVAKRDGAERARPEREGRGLLDDAENHMRDFRGQVERQIEEMRRQLAELDHTFAWRIPTIDFEGDAPRGRASGSLVENGRSLTYSVEEDGRVKVTVKDGEDAPEKVYEAKNLDELRKEAPEVAARLEPLLGHGGRFVLRFAGPNSRGLRLDGDLFPRQGDEGQVPAESAPPQVLGIEWAPVPDVLREQLDLKDAGVAIERVVPGSLAEKLGLQRHDVLLQVQGKPVAGSPDVRAALEGTKTGDKVTALVLRKGQRQTLEVTK